MNFFIIISIGVLLAPEIFCIYLRSISVPSMYLIDGKNDELLILDCEYELPNEDISLVVKWFKDNNSVYQWIRGQKPSVFPQFKGLVDESYETSQGPNHQYRALALVNPTINSTGIYKCVVQTASETHAYEKKLQVVDVSNFTINLDLHKMQNESYLQCVVDQVYPAPVISLSTDDDDPLSIISEKVVENEAGLYNATVIAAIKDDDDDEDVYECMVTFNGIPYNLTKTVTSGCTLITTEFINKLLLIFVTLFTVM